MEETNVSAPVAPVVAETATPVVASPEVAAPVAAPITDASKDSAALAAPVAAPQQQIAPISANGENTSAREAPKADVPANVQDTAGISPISVPPQQTDMPANSPAVSDKKDTAIPNPKDEEMELEFGKPLGYEEATDPFKEAEGLISQMEGKMRLY